MTALESGGRNCFCSLFEYPPSMPATVRTPRNPPPGFSRVTHATVHAVCHYPREVGAGICFCSLIEYPPSMPTTVRTPRNPHYRAHTTEPAPGVFAGHTRSEQRAWLLEIRPPVCTLPKPAQIRVRCWSSLLPVDDKRPRDRCSVCRCVVVSGKQTLPPKNAQQTYGKGVSDPSLRTLTIRPKGRGVGSATAEYRAQEGQRGSSSHPAALYIAVLMFFPFMKELFCKLTHTWPQTHEDTFATSRLRACPITLALLRC